MSDEEFKALRAFTKAHGRYWKAELRKSWMNGVYAGVSDEVLRTLQCLRNASYFGPEGLIKYKSGATT